MKKNWLLKIGIPLCLISIAFAAILVFSGNANIDTDNQYNVTSRFNMDPDQTLENNLPFADLIVVGKIVSDAETHESALPSAKMGLTQKYTSSQLEIEEVLYGTESSKTITFTQLGEAGDDKEEKKVKKGDRMLFILHKHPNGYNSVSLESGLYSIDDNNKIKPLFKGNSLKKYEGVKFNDFKKEIKESLKKLNKQATE